VRRRALTDAAVVLAIGVVAGCLVASRAAPVLQSRMLLWVLGRGLGLAGYLCVTVAMVLGLWSRHPWRRRLGRLNPTVVLRLHMTLVAAAGVLIIGHVVAIALDRYAHVGWTGALVPGRSRYRPVGVAAGTVGLYAAVLIAATARFAGWIASRSWLRIHRTSGACFFVLWVHGVLAGSDLSALRGLYVVSGLVVVGLAVSRRLAPDPLDAVSEPESKAAAI
jgi:hypothetical protein